MHKDYIPTSAFRLFGLLTCQNHDNGVTANLNVTAGKCSFYNVKKYLLNILIFQVKFIFAFHFSIF